MRTIMTFTFSLCLLHSAAIGQQQLQILTPPGGKPGIPKEASFGLGYSIGSQLASGGFEAADVSKDDFIKGLLEGLAGKEPSLDEATMQKAMQQLDQIMQQRAQVREAQRQVANQKFLEDNKKKDGVIETDSGLQYEVLKSGSGASPTAQSRVTVHYEGKFTNGQVFDSSIQRGEPATFPVTGVIKGWTEALLSMKVGDRWRLVVPSDLAYGPGGNPPRIPPNEPLVFEVELLSVQ